MWADSRSPVETLQGFKDCLLDAAKRGGQGKDGKVDKEYEAAHKPQDRAQVSFLLEHLSNGEATKDGNNPCGVELHAHVNGSISPQLLNVLIERKNNFRAEIEAERKAFQRSSDENEGEVEVGAGDVAEKQQQAEKKITMMSDSDETLTAIQDPKDRMKYCFQVFDTIYQVMDNLEATEKAVEDVLLGYAVEGVTYLELRTSLREMKYFEDDRKNFKDCAGDYRSFKSGSQEEKDAFKLASREEYVEVVMKTINRLTSPEGGDKLGDRLVDQGKTGGYWRWYDIQRSQRAGRGLPYSGGPRKPTRLAASSTFNQEIVRRLKQMKVKLLLSVNRGAPVPVAEETVGLALKFFNQGANAETTSVTKSKTQRTKRGREDDTEDAKKTSGVEVVGIDLGGNCYKGKFSELLPSLSKAKKAGMKITLHAAEKKDDGEMQEMIDFKPDRFGHVCFLNDEHKTLLQKPMDQGGLGVPVEFCITSNMLTSGFNCPLQHQIQEWFFYGPAEEDRFQTVLDLAKRCDKNPLKRKGKPDVGESWCSSKELNAALTEYLDFFRCGSGASLSINTDDRGVFYTTLFQEHLYFAVIVANGLLDRVKRVQEEIIDNSSKTTTTPTAFGIETAKKRLEKVIPRKFLEEVFKGLYASSLDQGF